MIVYCCSDLIFATKIGSTADALSVGARPARNSESLAKRLEQVDDGKLNEPVEAVLVDMDLEEKGIELIQQAKAHDAELPVIAFGAHVAVELLESARAAGADVVMPRGQFTASLPGILEKFQKAE